MIAQARSSIVRRVALASMAVALAAVAGLGVATYLIVSWSSAQALRTTVDTDLAGLADIYASSGREELVARLGDRLALEGLDGRLAHYMLVTADGRKVAGDLDAMPTLSADTSQAGRVAFDGKASGVARATRLSRDLTILVGREDGVDRALLVRLMWLFAVVGAAIVLGVGMLAQRQSRQIARRLERINRAYRGAYPRDRAALADESQRDEIGELARHSGAALERLAGLIEAQRHVSDNVAHEIRTPLMRLDQRLLGLLKQSDNTSAEGLGQARSDIRGIVAMLESLLDIAASEARRGDTGGLESFELSALAEDVADVYRNSMEEAGLRFSCSIAPGVKMLGEPMHITRLISNLLDNAIKFVPAGGTVRLEVAKDGALSVCDDGPGIPEDARADIFDRFRRGIPHGPLGHGLGLALARAIAQRHGRNLRLEDSPQGCNFLMTGASQ